jgi:hypothetical protein
MPGMGGGPMGGMHQGPVKDKPITRQLGCTLEELYTGSTRKMKITRTIFDGSGRATRSEEEILELAVKPGWKKGTKLTFQHKGETVISNSLLVVQCLLQFSMLLIASVVLNVKPAWMKGTEMTFRQNVYIVHTFLGHMQQSWLGSQHQTRDVLQFGSNKHPACSSICLRLVCSRHCFPAACALPTPPCR